ncbi:hypothetical protein BH18ACI4_BH18ACI4_11100 [soil metagenome]
MSNVRLGPKLDMYTTKAVSSGLRYLDFGLWTLDDWNFRVGIGV